MAFRTSPTCLVLVSAVSLAALLALPGCGSSGSSSDSSAESSGAIPDADGGLAGQYVADDVATSPFASITIVDDTRYLLEPTSCPDTNDCRQQGWYTVTGDEIELHDDLGDAEVSYPLSVLASGTLPADTGDDDAGSDDSDGGVTPSSVTADRLTAADDLVTGNGSLVGRKQVYSLQVGKSSYHLVNSAGQLVNASNASSLVKSSGPLVGSHLDFEGTCGFLHDCSSFSKKLPSGEVSWGCVGVKVCSDTDHWLAGPTSAYCNKTVTVCNGSKCATGTVLDVSDAKAWEGSEGLLGAIGLPYGLSSTCSGYGGGTVTIRE